MTEPLHQCSTTLRDADPDHAGRVPVRLAVGPDGVALHADGYGDRGTAPGHGSPVFVELYRGELRLVVWADITTDEPTHVIPLGGAREALRRTDDVA